MTYTNNVPQGNQTIASTTDPIRNNFAFLEDSIGQEHNFDSSDATKTWHLQAAMPNSAGAPTKPVGTDGVYYIDGGEPKFYDGTQYFISYGSKPQYVVTGSVALSNAGAVTVFTSPQRTVGSYQLIFAGSPVSPDSRSAMGQFIAGTGTMHVGAISDPGLDITTSGLSLQAKPISSSDNGTYNYVITYVTP